MAKRSCAKYKSYAGDKSPCGKRGAKPAAGPRSAPPTTNGGNFRYAVTPKGPRQTTKLSVPDAELRGA